MELYRQKRVRRNLSDGTWQWDQDAVEAAAVTNNVVELVLRKVVELPERTQEVLGQAACAGHSFSFGELAVLTGLAASQLVEELRPALLAGLVIPSDGQYREAQALAQAQKGSELDAGYRFLHDRVQQAFYERIAPEQRSRTHLQIGRRLERAFNQHGGSNQKLLELARHLNLGATALESDGERKELSRLNLRAAKAAKASGSYRLQATLVEQAQALLGKAAWEEEPQLAIELALERIEADYMLRAFDEVHRRAQELLVMPLPAVSRLAAQELRVRTCVASGQYGEGERLGLQALEEQGIQYPESNEACFAEAIEGIKACDAWLDAHPEGFRDMPAELSPLRLLCDAIQAAMLVCAGFGSRPALTALTLVRAVQTSIEKLTLTPVAPFFLGAFGCGRSAMLGAYRGGVRWVREGMQAAQRLASPFLPECSFYDANYKVYEEPAERSREGFQATLRAARAAGSFQGTSWALLGELYYLDVWAGRSLEHIAAQEASQRDLMVRAGDAIGRHFFALAESYTTFLRTPSSLQLLSKSEWLTAHSRGFLEMGNGFLAEAARIQEAHLFLAFGELARALERAEEAERFRSALFGDRPVTDAPLWLGLSAAKCCLPTLPQEQRTRLLAQLEYAIERFRYFSDGCAANFLHKLRLLEAERARLQGKFDEALAKYDEAMALARTEGFLHIEALAAQFCAESFLQAGRERVASLYFHEARDAYTRWGALALVSFLEQKYPKLLLHPPSASLSADSVRTAASTSTTRTTGGVAIDVDTTVRAAQALASELDPQRVVAALMRLVQENAGAQRAALLLYTADELSVTALLSGSQVCVGLAESLSASHPVAPSIVQYVVRSREALVLSDAPADTRFAQDAHLRAASIRSVLAVPLVHQGRLGGILYLEHDGANAFPQARVHLLSVLAAQGAIALENARLYADLQAANAGLEVKVAERTAELNKALKDLWSEMDLAKKIQTVLLPSTPQVQGYDLAAVMRPADQVGGDYYDVFRRGQQDWVLIGDVSGHGVQAGLCMMMIQSTLRAVAMTLERSQALLTPRRLLGLVNETVESNLRQIGRGHYMTITALCIDGGSVRYAGLHQDLLIYRAAQDRVECVETQGVWLGTVDGDISEYLEDEVLKLEPDDVLLLYTDGYTEAKLGERMLGASELAGRFKALCKRAVPSAELIAGLLDSLKKAVVPDDVTLIALRRLGSAAAPTLDTRRDLAHC